MYSKELSYKDYDGKQRVETFWFHLNEVELIEIEFEVDPNGMLAYLARIQKAEDKAAAIRFIKMLIHKSFGIKSLDGKQFMKSDKIWSEFEYTAAYPALFMTLMSSEVEMEAFVNGIVPAEARDRMTFKKAEENNPAEVAPPVSAISMNQT